MVHPPIVTGLAAAFLGLVYMKLTLDVVKQRRMHKTSMGGDGGEGELAQTIRVHGNFMEYTPFAIILMALAELSGLWWPVVSAAAACLVLGRLLHARSWVDGKTFFKPRVRGMWLTFAAYVISCFGPAGAIFAHIITGL